MKSIFQKTCPAIQKVFESAEQPDRVVIVPIDYAKKTHMALICNGAGHQLRKPFPVQNNPEGVSFLEDVIEGVRRKHGLQAEHVILAGEDGGSFTFNFIHALCVRGRLVIGVNAQDAKAERKQMAASTDKIDLQGIVSLILKREGREVQSVYTQATMLRGLTHHRDALVRSQTASSLRMHTLVDQLCPGFLDSRQSGVSPFTDASLWLMSERFSPAQLRARRTPALIRKLRDFQVDEPEETARQIKALANSVLPPPEALSQSLQFNLCREVEVYQALQQSVHRSTADIARHLAATPGAMLTTMPAVAIVSAAGLYAELADPARRRALPRMAAYAGIVTRLKQTGGPEKEARSAGRHRRGNKTLNNILYMMIRQLKQNGHPELREDYARRLEAGQDVRFTMARRMLRIVMHLIEHNAFFLPPSLLEDPNPDRAREYYQKSWKGILIKWRNAGAIRQAFAENAPLEQWRRMLNERYDLRLSNVSPQHGQTT